MYYGWWLTGAAALIIFIGSVPVAQGLTLWFSVLEDEFDWSRTQLAFCFVFTRLVAFMVNPVSGFLVDKLGSRNMTFCGLPVVGLGFLALSQVNHLWHFYASFLMLTLGATLGAWLPMMAALNNWFRRRRATAMGLAMEGFSIGGALLAPALAWSIDPAAPERFGWRLTAAGIGTLILLLAWPVSRLVRDRPEQYGLLPDGLPRQDADTDSGQAGAPDDSQSGYTLREALRTRAFWLIAVGNSMSSAVVVTLLVHMGPMLTADRGYSVETLGWVVAVFTVFTALFTLVGGLLGDRSIRVFLFIFNGGQAAAMLVLLAANAPWMTYAFSIILGASYGGRVPLAPAVRGVYFGRRAYASITAITLMSVNITMIAAPLYAGLMYDRLGDYTAAFLTMAAATFAGSLMFLFLPRPPATPARG